MATSIHPFWLIFASAVMALVPMFMALVTSYMKVSIVLGMLRNGLGTQQVPSASVIAALSLALSFFIMSPVVESTMQIAVKQDMSFFKSVPRIEDIEKYKDLLGPWKDFMKKHTGDREQGVFLDLLSASSVNGEKDVEAMKESYRVIIPSFVMTELKQGFAMAFVVLLPFLVIDLIVANLLIGMGMMMVSPVMISLPLKLILFVMSDAWILLARGIINSY